MADQWTDACRRQRAAYNAWQTAPAGPGWTEALDAYVGASADLERIYAAQVEASRQRKARFVAAATGEPVEVALSHLKR